jgi:hypothetical protein
MTIQRRYSIPNHRPPGGPAYGKESTVLPLLRMVTLFSHFQRANEERDDGNFSQGRVSAKEGLRMSWRGRSSFTFALVSVALCMLVAAFASAAPPSPPSLQQYVPPSEKIGDGRPYQLGPSLVDAIYRSAAAPGVADDSLFVIFSEDVDSGEIDAADFNINGGVASGMWPA